MSGDRPTKIYEILLVNARVASITTSSSEFTNHEIVTITADSVGLKFLPQNADGSVGQPAGGTFTHWVLYDMPARVTHWPSEGSGKTIRNSFGRSGYGGPCPPPGDRPHGYVFSVHAAWTAHAASP